MCRKTSLSSIVIYPKSKKYFLFLFLLLIQILFTPILSCPSEISQVPVWLRGVVEGPRGGGRFPNSQPPAYLTTRWHHSLCSAFTTLMHSVLLQRKIKYLDFKTNLFAFFGSATSAQSRRDSDTRTNFLV